MTESFFIERLDEIELRAREARAFEEVKQHRHAGYAQSRGPRETFVTLPVDERLPASVPEAIRSAALPLGEPPPLFSPADVLSALVLPLMDIAQEAGANLQLTLRHLVRRTVCLPHHTDVSSRESVILELRVGRERDGKRAFLQREVATASASALLARRTALEAQVTQLAASAEARLDAAALEGPERTEVVLPPGADAGVLFHELCGHPLEGDVVAHSASYLAGLRGAAVAPEFLDVVDDPTAGGGTLSYVRDDEGSLAQRVHLLRQGRIHEPLLDRAFASRLGLETNGHARRGSYRAPALPRMAHTAVLGHAGTFEEIVSRVQNGVLIRGLTPRHVHLQSGDFSFFVDEAQRIRNGRVTGFLRPTVLRGNALETLRRIDAVGEDAATFFGLKACGKAETPVAVSFGNPTLHISQMELVPR